VFRGEPINADTRLPAGCSPRPGTERRAWSIPADGRAQCRSYGRQLPASMTTQLRPDLVGYARVSPGGGGQDPGVAG